MSQLTKLFVFFNALFFTGCTLTPQQPAVHDFGISHPEPYNKLVTRPDISVEAPKWLQDNRIRYRLLYAEPTRVRFYTMDRWIAPPSELLEQRLKSGEINLKYPLIIRLLDFEQQFVAPQKAKAMMRFSAEAYTPDHQVMVHSREFRFEQETLTPDAEGAVNAFAELTSQASDRIRFWLDGLTAK
jgi:cholesterol transport system auxiliary component